MELKKNYFGLLLCIACAADSTTHGDLGWSIDKDVASQLRSALVSRGERAGEEGVKLSKKGLEDLLHSFRDPDSRGHTNMGSSWYQCELDTVDADDLTRSVFQDIHANKVCILLTALL